MKIGHGSSLYSWRNNVGNYRRSIPKSPIWASMWRIWLNPCKIYISSPQIILLFPPRRQVRPAIIITIITIIIEHRWSVYIILTVPIRLLPIRRRRRRQQIQQRISRSTCHLFFDLWIQWFHLVVVDSVVRSRSIRIRSYKRSFRSSVAVQSHVFTSCLITSNQIVIFLLRHLILHNAPKFFFSSLLVLLFLLLLLLFLSLLMLLNSRLFF